ncbi:MAG TPA: hypothetical protein DCE41_05535 [Cytophagales bacterium]|nr:hypothetical protein [Cytophagales bacterium]HAA18663.1 hypothetical protein [Cytophagales bacterium]HAP62264.1 hypothetical protein [Cytophagales bacterium]
MALVFLASWAKLQAQFASFLTISNSLAMQTSTETPALLAVDYLIIGAGAMGLAFADEMIRQNDRVTLALVDRRPQVGGHWVNAYPFVRLHQPAAYYGVNSMELSTGTGDLSSKDEILAYYEQLKARLEGTGRVQFFMQHQYVGDHTIHSMREEGRSIRFTVQKKLVDATYMNVEVPSVNPPKYQVEASVPLVPINEIVREYPNWNTFFILGAGKTAFDAILYLLDKGIDRDQIHWVVPNEAWLFDRAHIQTRLLTKQILDHGEMVTKAKTPSEVFRRMEKKGGIFRINHDVPAVRWKCATVSPGELEKLRSLQNVYRYGRVVSIDASKIEFKNGTTVPYPEKTLFVDCTSNAAARIAANPLYSEGRLTLQPIVLCQQVFSAAFFARLEHTKLSDLQKNKFVPVPHPEFEKDWPMTIANTLQNVLRAHTLFPLWMYRSRLFFMSHERLGMYLLLAIRAAFLFPRVKRAARRLALRNQ